MENSGTEISKVSGKPYECNECLESDPINFYPYLKSKCKNCKKKISREVKSETLKEKRLNKLNDIDADYKRAKLADTEGVKLRETLEILLKKDRVIDNKSIFDYISTFHNQITELSYEMNARFAKASVYMTTLYDKNIELTEEIKNLKDIINKLENKSL